MGKDKLFKNLPNLPCTVSRYSGTKIRDIGFGVFGVEWVSGY